jgi:hypothetical protein
MIVNPTLSQMSLRDIDSTYAGTYLRFNTVDDDGWWVGQVEHTDCSDGPAIVVTKCNGERRILNLRDNRVMISLKYPSLGNVNHKKHSWFIRRKAVRQWKKGLRTSLLHTKVNGSCMLEALQPYGYSLDNSVIEEIYEPTYTPYFEAIEEVSAGNFISRAISSYFAVANIRDVDKPVLMYKGTIIGVYHDNTLALSEDLSHLKPMIERIVPHGYNNSIVIQP